MSAPRSRRVASLGVLLIAAAFHAWYATHGLALFDLGILVDGAARTLDGEWFARDFVAPYGPLRYWLLAAAFATCGASLATWCGLAVALQAGVNAVVFHLTWKRSRWWGAALATAMVMVAHGSLHKTFLLVASVLVLLAAQELLGRDRPRPVRAGLLLGLAGLLRYDAGVFGLVALLAGLALMPHHRRFSGGARLVLGATALTLPVVLFLLAAGASGEEWWSLTLQRVAVQERIDYSLPGWRNAEGSWAWGGIGVRGLLAGLLLLYGATLGPALLRACGRRSRDGDGWSAATGLFGLFLLNQARLIPSANHVFQALLPAAILAGWQLAAPERRRAGPLVLTAITALLITYVHLCTSGPYPGSYTVRREARTFLDLPRAQLFVTGQEDRDLRQVIRYIQELVPPEGAVATGPGCALLAFLSDRRLGVPFAEPSYYYRSERFQQMVIETLDREQPAVFVHDRRPAATFRFEEEAPVLARHVQDHYQPWREVGPFLVLRRR